jgi:hypothetical protein
MLGFVKRSCFHASDPKVRNTLYLTLVKRQRDIEREFSVAARSLFYLFHFKQMFHTLKYLLSSTFFQLPTGMNTWILFIYSNVFMKTSTKM